MNLHDTGEFGFINRVTRGCIVKQEGVVRAIGDDAAAFHTPSGEISLITTDLLIERVHFIRLATSGYNLGYKALAVNLSDIAAMGGAALHAFVSIAIPEDCTIEYLDDLYSGMKDLAARFDVNILGGDTSRSKTDLAINITVAGSAPEGELMLRSGAKPGDVVCLTGPVGDSRAGLHFILNGIKPQDDGSKRLINAHLLPKAYLKEGRFLAASGAVHAAIDVSDGLSSDLGHILEESRVGARIYADRMPLSQYLLKFCERSDKDPVAFALAGGEDYVLACTLDRNRVKTVFAQYREEFGETLYAIGEVTDTPGIELIRSGGSAERIAGTGWNHFA